MRKEAAGRESGVPDIGSSLFVIKPLIKLKIILIIL